MALTIDFLDLVPGSPLEQQAWARLDHYG